VVQPAVTDDGKKAPGLKFGQPRVMALLAALTMFHHLLDGFRNHDLRKQVADLPGVTLSEYTLHQMTYDLRRLRLKGLIYRPPKIVQQWLASEIPAIKPQHFESVEVLGGLATHQVIELRHAVRVQAHDLAIEDGFADADRGRQRVGEDWD
jgi:hypothetical protein